MPKVPKNQARECLKFGVLANYRCHTASCPTKTVREDRIEKALLELLSALRLTPDQMAEVRHAALTLLDHHVEREDAIRRSLELNLQKLKSREARLVDAYVDGVIDGATYRDRRGLLLEEKVGVEHKLRDLGADEQTLRARVQTFLELAKSALQSYLRGSLDEKRELIKTVTSNRNATEKAVIFQPVSAFEYLRQRDIESLVVIVSKSPNSFPTKPLTSHARSAWWLETASYALIAW